MEECAGKESPGEINAPESGHKIGGKRKIVFMFGSVRDSIVRRAESGFKCHFVIIVRPEEGLLALLVFLIFGFVVVIIETYFRVSFGHSETLFGDFLISIIFTRRRSRN